MKIEIDYKDIGKILYKDLKQLQSAYTLVISNIPEGDIDKVSNRILKFVNKVGINRIIGNIRFNKTDCNI